MNFFFLPRLIFLFKAFGHFNASEKGRKNISHSTNFPTKSTHMSRAVVIKVMRDSKPKVAKHRLSLLMFSALKMLSWQVFVQIYFLWLFGLIS